MTTVRSLVLLLLVLLLLLGLLLRGRAGHEAVEHDGEDEGDAADGSGHHGLFAEEVGAHLDNVVTGNKNG